MRHLSWVEATTACYILESNSSHADVFFSVIQMPPWMKHFYIRNAVSGVQKVTNNFSKWKKTGVIFDSDMMTTWWVLNHLFICAVGVSNSNLGEHLYCVRFFMLAIVYRNSTHHREWKWNRNYFLKIRFAIFIKDMLVRFDVYVQWN